MYICLCSGVTDQQVKDCASDGCTFKELISKLNCCKICSICTQEVLAVYNSNREQN